MSFKNIVWTAGAVVVIGAVAFGAYRFMPMSKNAGPAAHVEAVLATPVGVTIQFTGPLAWSNGVGYQYGGVASQPRAYADDHGMTYYTYDKDTQPGKSVCNDQCAKFWPPATPLANAQPVGDWSLITRDDGTKQWALKGKPLYRFAQDATIGEVKGKAAVTDGWHVALFKPADGVPTPNGLSIQEVGDANAQVLTNEKGLTIYAFDDDPRHDNQACSQGPCTDYWTPVTAPEMAGKIGDFTVIARDDGINQWAYKGQPLYTYVNDLETGDANGIGVDSHWHVASVVRYFMPAEVAIRPNMQFGPILATADGMSIYWRDAYLYQLGGHEIRHGTPPRPVVGRNIGLRGCDAECLKTWHPVKAPADALPSGYWATATRDDGSKQWVYKGFALYTYAGDKRAGDLMGNDLYDIIISEDPNKLADLPSRFTAAGGLLWIHAYP